MVFIGYLSIGGRVEIGLNGYFVIGISGVLLFLVGGSRLFLVVGVVGMVVLFVGILMFN